MRRSRHGRLSRAARVVAASAVLATVVVVAATVVVAPSPAQACACGGFVAGDGYEGSVNRELAALTCRSCSSSVCWRP
ncbi:MAG: hypothetical protein JJE50_01710 [Actinomycetales bacterium]|nr:hypothetical protein [Actinomycetales bacterium]